MDSKISTENLGSVDLPRAESEGLAASVGEKRPAENGEGGGLGVPSPKKARSGGRLVGNVKKVAEIVLVLAAMGKMRGGRNPTAAEKEMMKEARDKLVEVCEEFAPKDVFPRDAFGAVIEDLGLNKLREQRLGFRPPKMSIAEKLLFTKQKMEKSGEHSLHSSKHSSQRFSTNIGAAAESRGASHTPKLFSSDKPIHATVSSGGFQPASTLGHVSAANSTSLPYQLPASEVRTSTVSGGLPTSLPGADSSSSVLPGAQRPHFRLDSRSNGSSHVTQVQANSCGDHTLLNTPAGSQQSQSSSLGKSGVDNKVMPQPPLKVEGTVKVEGTANINTPRMAPQAVTSKSFIAQTPSGHLPTIHSHGQGMSFSPAPFLSNGHTEIGKIVQKLLHPKPPQHPTWTPPSRDYMNKAVTCQVCRVTIDEVENILVCDACEKGYHLKCLQSQNQRGIPRGEWHCFKCLSLSNGKPLPPKYGRVTRNTPKVPSNSAAVQSSPERRAGILGEKGNQQKITENGSSGFVSAPAGSMFNNHNLLTSASNMPNARGFGRKRQEQVVSEMKGQSPAKPSGTNAVMLDQLQGSSNSHDSGQIGLPHSSGILSKHTVKDLEKPDTSSSSTGNLNYNIQQEEERVARPEPIETSGTSILSREHVRYSSSNDVDWIGDIVQVVKEKTYYPSCCINGVVYKVHDHALICSDNDKQMPCKLQAMWEDSKSRSKWVIANRCYFPEDLPETVGRPCSPESNEVYESNHGTAIMAGLIRGPCEVLPPRNFIEESERRSRFASEANNRSRPLFLCKWFYDESKGVFRDVSS